MSDPIVKVAPNKPITAKLIFDGIANHYEAYLYAPLGDADQWEQTQTLATNGSSEDARPDELTFDAPAPGKRLLLYFQSGMTSVSMPADVGVTAVIIQGGAELGRAPKKKHITSYDFVELRVRLEAS